MLLSASALLLSLSLSLSLGGVDAAKRPEWNELEGYTFEQFVEDFHLPISSNSSSYFSQKATFLVELERVKRHNNAGLPWKENVNKFSSMTETDKKGTFGRSKVAKAMHKPKSLKVIINR